jgi:hypothetical protein
MSQDNSIRRAQEAFMLRSKLAVAVAALILATPAFADEPDPDNDGGRYSLNKVQGGFVRLDTQSGQVSLCSQHSVGWACETAPEDRAVFENEIARLRSENAALKKDILSHGLALPPGIIPEAPGTGSAEVILRLPDNADVDRAMTYVGRIWQRFVDAVARAGKQVLNKS